jgi:zinc/manganese transport system substrate-binding protein
MDKPQNVSRSNGDVHPDGNPHFALNIENIVPIAELISMKLAQVDPSNADKYNKNFEAFKSKMETLATKLKEQYASCQGKKVVQYHELFNYAMDEYGVNKAGNIEPLPGISPSSKHTLELINLMKEQKVTTILQDVYHEKKTAKFIASKTGATVKIVPHDVGAVEGTETLESFYETIARELCQ